MRSTLDFRLACLVAAILMLTPAVRADDPLGDDGARAVAMIDLFTRHLAENERHYDAVVVPLLDPATTEDRRTRAIREARKELDERTAGLAAVRARHAARKLDLGDAVRQCNGLGTSAIKNAFKLSIDVAGTHVDGLSYRNRESARAMQREYAERLEALESGLKGDAKAREAAVAALRGEFEVKERGALEQLRKDYDAVTARLVADRRELCGQLWRLADFQEKRERQDLARATRAEVYGTFERHLTDRGVAFHNRWFGGWSAKNSTLDFFIAFPGSPDRLIVAANWAKVADSPWKMNAALVREPVETMRQFENPPAVHVTGSQLEQLCRMLSVRLLALHAAKGRLDAGFAALKAANARAGSLADFPDAGPLRGELKRVIDKRYSHTVAKNKFDQATAAVNQAEEALAAAEREERFARSELRLTPKTLKVAAAGDQKSELASRLLADARRQLAAATALADDPSTGKAQRDAMRANTLPRLQAEVNRIAAAIDAAIAPKVSAIATARGKRDQARVALDRAPNPGTVDEIRREWDGSKSAYEAIAARGKAALNLRVAPFPAEPDGEPANRCVDTLTEIARRLDAVRNDLRWSSAESLGELRQADHDVRMLAASVAGLRSGGAALAETTLAELGAKPGDAIVAELERLKEACKETEAFCQDYNKRLGQFGKVLDKLSKDAKAKGLLSATSERVELIEKTFGRVAGTIDLGLKLKQIRDQLSDDRTVLQGIGGVLELTQNAAESVPVAGPLVAQALGYYATAARSCGEAAVAIQGKLVEQDLAVHFSHPPPERHLYTEDEMSNIRVGNDNARDRAKRMLQVRRLIALIGSEDASVARELTR